MNSARVSDVPLMYGLFKTNLPVPFGVIVISLFAPSAIVIDPVFVPEFVFKTKSPVPFVVRVAFVLLSPILTVSESNWISPVPFGAITISPFEFVDDNVFVSNLKLSMLITPPTFKFSAIPTPPSTTNAPVVVDV